MIFALSENSSNSSPTYTHMILAFFYWCIGRFVSNLVGNPEYRFSHVAALLAYGKHVCAIEICIHVLCDTRDTCIVDLSMRGNKAVPFFAGTGK